jgi:hypothetical protein
MICGRRNSAVTTSSAAEVLFFGWHVMHWIKKKKILIARQQSLEIGEISN